MKSFPVAILLTALLGGTPAPAQSQKPRTNDAYTLELLRRTLDEQQRNPEKVIRTATNLPPATVAAAAPVAPVAPAHAPASSELAELERQYLAGKLSAKQYQKAVEQAQKKAAGKSLATPAISPKAAAASGVKVVAPEPMIATPPPVPNPNLQKLSDVDQKIEELLQRNRERAKAAAAAAAALPTSNPNGAPLSKRQRLDLLLRQVVEGKMTDEEYKTARAKIAAEPD